MDHLKSEADVIVSKMSPSQVGHWSLSAGGNFDVRIGQTSHNSGGASMGIDPSTSVVNPYLQAWDAENVFIVGASAFPQGSGYNPTGTVGALAYRAAKAITEQYVKSPGPLIRG
jgi:gluconate 2-dehydrogenase alpha chain